MSLNESPIFAALHNPAQHCAQRQTQDVAEADQHPSTSVDRGTTENVRPQSKKKLQQIVTGAQRARIVNWMISTNESDGEKNLVSKTVKNFPLLFRTSPSAAHMKASQALEGPNS